MVIRQALKQAGSLAPGLGTVMVTRIGEMAEILKSTASKFDQFEAKLSMVGFLKVYPF